MISKFIKKIIIMIVLSYSIIALVSPVFAVTYNNVNNNTVTTPREDPPTDIVGGRRRI